MGMIHILENLRAKRAIFVIFASKFTIIGPFPTGHGLFWFTSHIVSPMGSVPYLAVYISPTLAKNAGCTYNYTTCVLIDEWLNGMCSWLCELQYLNGYYVFFLGFASSCEDW